MGLEVRRAVPEDAAGIAGVWAATMPQLVKTAKGIARELRAGKTRVVLVAVDDGRVVGYGNIYLPSADAEAPRVRIAVLVPPVERNRGVGTALATAVEEAAANAGAASLLVWVADDPAAKAFAEHRGFSIGRQMSHSTAVLADAPEPLPVPEGLRLVTFDEIEPRPLWEASTAVEHGDPSGLSTVPPYDEWLDRDWNHPDIRRDLSFALLDGDRVASFTTVTADPDRRVIWSNLTGTVPEYRGRGLATVVKSHALAASRDAGLTTAYTGNDADNQPMLAVNRRLGYRTAGLAWTAEKTLR